MIDSHIHIWSKATDPRRDPGPWTHTNPKVPYMDLGLGDVDDEMTQAEISGVVLVQAVNQLPHTDELLVAAAHSHRPAKVVGWLPLTEPHAVRSTLQRYRANREFAGVRHRVGEGDHPEFLLLPEVAHSLDLVAEAGLTLDVLPWPPGLLDQVPTIARRHPHLRIVIDMLGWPEIAQRRMQPWTDQVAAAAAQHNVHVKVGGLYRLSGQHAHQEAWRPYVATAVEFFGPDRMMLASNWPAMVAFGRKYTDTIAALLDSFDGLIETERMDVTAGTARRVYGFD